MREYGATTVPAISARGLTKIYRLYDRPIDRLKQFLWRGKKNFGREFVALADVSFEVKHGEVLGIVGKNGAGKSTLLQLICGTLQPTAGSLEVNGRVAALLELGAGFNPEFTGRENVFMNAALLGVSEDEVKAKFDDIVEFSGVGTFIDQPVKTYSSGMFVRLAFSVATAFEPDILVIDEALSVGDGAFARKSFERIMALKDRGATILFCSHMMYHIDALCERALWLDAGRVRMFDAAQKVTAAYNEFLAAEIWPTDAKQEYAVPSVPVATAPSTARILEVRGFCEGVAGLRLPVVSRTSTLTIKIKYATDPSLPLPTVAIFIESAAGVGVTSAISLGAEDAVVRNRDGSGWAMIRFPQIPLLKGRYFVTVFLACERGLHVYDVAPRCIELEVSQTDALQGLVALSHEWVRPT